MRRAAARRFAERCGSCLCTTDIHRRVDVLFSGDPSARTTDLKTLVPPRAYSTCSSFAIAPRRPLPATAGREQNTFSCGCIFLRRPVRCGRAHAVVLVAARGQAQRSSLYCLSRRAWLTSRLLLQRRGHGTPWLNSALFSANTNLAACKCIRKLPGRRVHYQICHLRCGFRTRIFGWIPLSFLALYRPDGVRLRKHATPASIVGRCAGWTVADRRGRGRRRMDRGQAGGREGTVSRAAAIAWDVGRQTTGQWTWR